MYNTIDVYKLIPEIIMSRFTNRTAPCNEMDRIINFSDYPAKKKLLEFVSEKEITSICLRPYIATVEQLSLISGVYGINFFDLFYMCAETMALHLYHTSSKEDKIESFRDVLNLKDARYEESRLSQGFRMDLQNAGKRLVEVRKIARAKGGKGFSVKL